MVTITIEGSLTYAASLDVDGVPAAMICKEGESFSWIIGKRLSNKTFPTVDAAATAAKRSLKIK